MPPKVGEKVGLKDRLMLSPPDADSPPDEREKPFSRLLMPPGARGPNIQPAPEPTSPLERSSLERRFGSALERTEASSIEQEEDFLERAGEFDPYTQVGEAARGAFDLIREPLGEDIEALRGSAVAAGRLNTGFQTEDEDRLIRGALDRLNSEIARNAVAAAGLDLERIQSIGSFASSTNNSFLELLGGGFDIDEENRRRETEEEEKKGSIFGTIGSILGGVGGFFLGGPPGAAIGSQLGGGLGGLIGSI